MGSLNGKMSMWVSTGYVGSISLLRLLHMTSFLTFELEAGGVGGEGCELRVFMWR